MHTTIQGKIIPGEGEGRAIGFPTANLNTLPENISLENGIYSGYATVNETVVHHPAAIIIRPRNNIKTIEVHILDFNQNIYNQHVTLEIQDHVRDWQTISDTHKLVSQIKKDITVIRACLESK